MPRSFNTAGPCRADIDYMLPASTRLPQVMRLIDEQRYFILHAPRQTGKTTAFLSLAAELTAGGRYVAALLSMEVGAPFEDDPGMAEGAILSSWQRAVEAQLPKVLQPEPWPEARSGDALGQALKLWAESAPRPLVVFLDEIDALADATLLSVLRQLRDGYRNRPAHFPCSLALIGLRDVRDYKFREGVAGRLGTASPFNIKVEQHPPQPFGVGACRQMGRHRQLQPTIRHQATDLTGQVIHHGAKGHRFERRARVCIDAGQNQQLVDQGHQALGLGDDVGQDRRAVLRADRRHAAQKLAVAPDRGQRRAQLVRSVGDEAALGLQGAFDLPVGGLQLGQHGVEGGRQAAHLVLGTPVVHPPVEVALCADQTRRVGDALDRLERLPGHHPAGAEAEEDDAAQEQEVRAEVAQVVVQEGQRGRDLQNAQHPLALPHGMAPHQQALAVEQHQRRARRARHQREPVGLVQRQRATLQAGASMMLELANEVTGVLTLFLGAIAGISLFVGGIGIMNIMLVSVTERTREIGLRKAVGARRSDILAQFLLESVALSVLGGLIGVLTGIGIAKLVDLSGLMRAVPSPWAILAALASALADGLFFGLYPANRAARLSPMEALRYQ